MRLIDADELLKDDELTLWLSNDAIRTGKTLKMFSELFVKKINEQPTIEIAQHETITKFADQCKECGARYGKLLKQKFGEWIPISDPPKTDGRYLTYIINGKLSYMMVCDYYTHGSWHPDDDTASNNVTYWMPLPVEPYPEWLPQYEGKWVQASPITKEEAIKRLESIKETYETFAGGLDDIHLDIEALEYAIEKLRSEANTND